VLFSLQLEDLLKEIDVLRLGSDGKQEQVHMSIDHLAK
jgi:hypothetical protein